MNWLYSSVGQRSSWPFCKRVLASGCIIACLLFGCVEKPSRSQTHRLVSLTPAITATLVEFGLAGHLVGISDHCVLGGGLPAPARVGSAMKPNLESIARLSPSLILSEGQSGLSDQRLGSIAPIRVLPWLSYEDLLGSTRILGRELGHQAAAEALIGRYQAGLASRISSTSPRVLLALSHPKGRLSPIWYVAGHTLHGRLLEAAGGKNAVQVRRAGAPRLSLEEVFAVDPDVVLILDPSGRNDAALLRDWQRLSALRAVTQGKLGLCSDPRAQATGPAILAMLPILRACLAQAWGSG